MMMLLMTLISNAENQQLRQNGTIVLLCIQGITIFARALEVMSEVKDCGSTYNFIEYDGGINAR